MAGFSRSQARDKIGRWARSGGAAIGGAARRAGNAIKGAAKRGAAQAGRYVRQGVAMGRAKYDIKRGKKTAYGNLKTRLNAQGFGRKNFGKAVGRNDRMAKMAQAYNDAQSRHGKPGKRR